MTKPTADSQAARLPFQPIMRRDMTANEYTNHVSTATKIFGSFSDISWRLLFSGASDLACSVQMTPTMTPIVRKAQPVAVALEFMRSRICSDGRRV